MADSNLRLPRGAKVQIIDEESPFYTEDAWVLRRPREVEFHGEESLSKEMYEVSFTLPSEVHLDEKGVYYIDKFCRDDLYL